MTLSDSELSGLNSQHNKTKTNRTRFNNVTKDNLTQDKLDLIESLNKEIEKLQNDMDKEKTKHSATRQRLERLAKTKRDREKSFERKMNNFEDMFRQNDDKHKTHKPGRGESSERAKTNEREETNSSWREKERESERQEEFERENDFHRQKHSHDTPTFAHNKFDIPPPSFANLNSPPPNFEGGARPKTYHGNNNIHDHEYPTHEPRQKGNQSWGRPEDYYKGGRYRHRSPSNESYSKRKGGREFDINELYRGYPTSCREENERIKAEKQQIPDTLDKPQIRPDEFTFNNYVNLCQKMNPHADANLIEDWVNAQLAFGEMNFVDRQNLSRVHHQDSSGIKVPWYVKSGSDFNAGKVSDQLRILKNQIVYLDNCNFSTFLRQFDNYSFKIYKVTESEFNTILHNFLGKEVKMRMVQNGFLPQECSSYKYLKELARISNSHVTHRDIENKLSNFKSNAADIIEIFNEIVVLQNQLPDELSTQRHKDRQLRMIIEKFMPESVTGILNETWITRNHQPPDRAALEAFLDRHRQTINNYLKRRNNKIGQISREKEMESEEETDRKKRTRKKVHKVESDRRKVFAKKELLNELYDSDSSVDSNNECNVVYEFDEMHKVAQPKMHSKDYEKSLEKKCYTCKTLGHTDNTCFRHPDKNISLKNQQRRNVTRCMLCGDSDHLSPYCTVYPNMTPSYTSCTLCTDAGHFCRFHPSTKCQQSQNKTE